MKQTSLKDAALALKAAVSALEKSLDPLIVNHAKLKVQAREAESFSEDRVKLAAQLDDALESRNVREAEFESLSKQTREELDATIEVLQQVLSGDDENG